MLFSHGIQRQPLTPILIRVHLTKLVLVVVVLVVLVTVLTLFSFFFHLQCILSFSLIKLCFFRKIMMALLYCEECKDANFFWLLVSFSSMSYHNLKSQGNIDVLPCAF